MPTGATPGVERRRGAVTLSCGFADGGFSDVRVLDDGPAPKRIEAPPPGQESVWDYPRPPRVEPVHARVTIDYGGVLIAESTPRAVRVPRDEPPARASTLPVRRTSSTVRSCPRRARRSAEVQGPGAVLRRHRWVATLPPASAWYYPSPSPGLRVDHPGSSRSTRAAWTGARSMGEVVKQAQEGALLRRLDHAEQRRALQGRAVEPGGW